MPRRVPYHEVVARGCLSGTDGGLITDAPSSLSALHSATNVSGEFQAARREASANRTAETSAPVVAATMCGGDVVTVEGRSAAADRDELVALESPGVARRHPVVYG